MGLSSGQRRHLISAYATISHLLLQMEEAGGQGRSPTGVGSPLSPLAPEEVRAVCAPLQELRQHLREYAVREAPEELAAFERPQDTPNTRVWLSNLLAKLQQAVDTLRPRGMRRYGRATSEDEEGLVALHANMAEQIGRARAVLDRHD